MLERKHLFYLIGAILLAILIVAAAFYWNSGSDELPPRESLSGKPDLLVFYDKGVAAEKGMAGATIAAPFLQAGMQWSTIGSATGDLRWYRQSRRVYEQGDVATNGRNSIITGNLAQTYIILGDNDAAKKAFERTIALSPGDTENYLAFISFMRYKLKSSPEEILAIYSEGISRSIGAAGFYISRAAYYRDLGRFDEARADIELVYKAGGLSEQLYKQALIEIEAAKNK